MPDRGRCEGSGMAMFVCLNSNRSMDSVIELMVYFRVSFSRSFTFPGIDTRQKGPMAFNVSSERHR